MIKTALACGAVAFVATFAACRAQEPPVPPTSASPSPASELEKMAARFAPTDIIADVSKLSPADRSVLAKLVEASKMIDALFLRQVWAGNEAMLLDLVRDETPEGRERLHYFLINKGPWSRLDHNQPFVPGAPAKPEGANFYPEGASKAEIERWIQSLPASERARATGFFTVVRRGPTGAFALVPYSMEYQNELVRIAASAARGRGAGHGADAEDVPREARRRLSLERLLRQRRRLDGARRAPSSRPSVRTRSTRTSSSTTRRPSSRSSRSATKPRARSSRSSAPSCRTSRTTCRSIRAAATRTRPAGAHRGRQRDLRRGRRQPRRPDRGLQPAQRRARDTGKGRQARDVEERPGREVREDSDADLEGRARAGRSGRRLVRGVLHAHPDARADARPRPAQHFGRRAGDDGAAGDERGVQLPRRSEGGHLRPVRLAVPDRQGRRAEVDGAIDLHHVSRVVLPFDPLRHQRSARPRDRDSAELRCSIRVASPSGRTAPSRSITIESRTA